MHTNNKLRREQDGLLFELGVVRCCKCLTLNSFVQLNIWINIFICSCFILLYCIYLAKFFGIKLFYCMWLRACASENMRLQIDFKEIEDKHEYKCMEWVKLAGPSKEANFTIDQITSVIDIYMLFYILYSVQLLYNCLWGWTYLRFQRQKPKYKAIYYASD